MYKCKLHKTTEEWLAEKKIVLRRHAAGERLTLDETALAIWNPKERPYPMTSMGILKIEKQALDKLKTQLKKYNINNLDDIFDPKLREIGKIG